MARRHLSKQERETIRERAFNCCEYCLCWDAYASQPFEVDHIIPVSRGGNTELDNLAYACGGYNGHNTIKSKLLILRMVN